MLSELESEMFMKSKTGIPFSPENSTSYISMRPKKNIPSDEKRIRLAIPHQQQPLRPVEKIQSGFSRWPHLIRGG